MMFIFKVTTLWPNKALQRTAADRRGYNHSFSAPLSLSFLR